MSSGTATAVTCYHCGEPVPPGVDFGIELDGAVRPMCCPGCRAVAALISDSGLTGFYRQRSAYNQRPETTAAQSADDYRVYDDPALLEQFSTAGEDGLRSARLLIGGITCAACTWLIERTLQQIPAVREASVNMSQSRLDVRFDPQVLPASRLFSQVAALGYRVKPWHSASQQTQARDEYRSDLRRLAVAGLGMMQVGMFAIALHAGDLQGINEEYRTLLRVVGLLVTSFVVWFSARGFFSSAWRHLRAGALVMDLPVSLAIGLAWAASAVATVWDIGDVYFDSVVMFTFLLLLARFIEKRMRYRDALAWQDAESLLPDAVQSWSGDGWQWVPRRDIGRGARLLLRAGDTVPVDGTVHRGRGSLREDSFSGESLPRAVAEGDTVFAGTVNLEGSLEVIATGGYADTRLAALQRSIDSAQLHKPALARTADRIAGHFIAAVLLITAATAIVWWQIDHAKAFWVALSVLVISCPCALSLATPASLANAAGTLRRHGVIVHGENALETLSRCDELLFDKTGTLTTGSLRVEDVQILDARWTEPEILTVASALQQHANHPLAEAFAGIAPASGIENVHYDVGAGLEGWQDSRAVRLGSDNFCRERVESLPAAPASPLYWIALCHGDTAVAWLGLADDLRPEVTPLLERLRSVGLTLNLLTGDSSPRAAELGRELGFDKVYTGLRPEQKLERVAALQRAGRVVAMIGDGLNDAPVLKLANVSVAVSGAADLARAQADFVLLAGDLAQIWYLYRLARKTRRVIVENLCWAIGYNAIGIPLAALGWVPPWAAALGMSLSSLLVVGNSLRLRRPLAILH